VAEDPIVEEMTAAVDRAGVLLWRLNHEVGVYSGATLQFSVQLAGEPWAVTLQLDEDGDVVWGRPGVDDQVRVVVYADGRLARDT
jgi:hypothetical protein